MKVGTILLSKNNMYVDSLGNLPKRPAGDKEMLSNLLYKQVVSNLGYNLLPPSLQAKCCIANDTDSIFPITIRELASCDLLIVSRSSEDIENGKVFRLNNFKRILKDRKVELWISLN